MTKSKKLSPTEQVSEHISKLDVHIAEIVEAIRRMVLQIDSQIGEQIKWNSPSFYYTGEMKEFDPKEYRRDILVLNLHRGRILLVFPSAAKLNDRFGVLEGDYTDGRRTVAIKDMSDLSSKQVSLQSVIKRWLELVDK